MKQKDDPEYVEKLSTTISESFKLLSKFNMHHASFTGKSFSVSDEIYDEERKEHLSSGYDGKHNVMYKLDESLVPGFIASIKSGGDPYFHRTFTSWVNIRFVEDGIPKACTIQWKYDKIQKEKDLMKQDPGFDEFHRKLKQDAKEQEKKSIIKSVGDRNVLDELINSKIVEKYTDPQAKAEEGIYKTCKQLTREEMEKLNVDLGWIFRAAATRKEKIERVEPTPSQVLESTMEERKKVL